MRKLEIFLKRRKNELLIFYFKIADLLLHFGFILNYSVNYDKNDQTAWGCGFKKTCKQ